MPFFPYKTSTKSSTLRANASTAPDNITSTAKASLVSDGSKSTTLIEETLRATDSSTLSAQLCSTLTKRQMPRSTIEKIWTFFETKHAGDYLKNASTFDKYCIACKYFHGWLALVVQNLSVDKLK